MGAVDRAALARVCAQGVGLASGAPYLGAAPHPIQVVGPGPGNSPNSAKPAAYLLDIGRTSAGTNPYLSVPAQDQLVGCLARTGETRTDVQCHYIPVGPRQVPLTRANYQLTVRAVRTGAVVDTVPVTPAAGGCPSSVEVEQFSPKVWNLPTNAQYVELMRRYVEWDGRGSPPKAGADAQAVPGGGPELDAGSVRLTAPPGADPATLELARNYLAFWDAYTAAQAQGAQYSAALRASTSPEFLALITGTALRSGDTRRGPVSIRMAVRSADAASATIDACVDESGRQVFAAGAATGELGIRAGWTTTLVRGASGSFVVSAFAVAPVGLCAVPG